MLRWMKKVGSVDSGEVAILCCPRSINFLKIFNLGPSNSSHLHSVNMSKDIRLKSRATL